MASNAAADSGAFFRVAANTSDHRVRGKIRGDSLDEVRLLMEISYPDENYRKSGACYSRSAKKLPAQNRQMSGRPNAYQRSGGKPSYAERTVASLVPVEDADLHLQWLTPRASFRLLYGSTAPVKVVQIKTMRFAPGFLFVAPP
jgi:hypothetical protein